MRTFSSISVEFILDDRPFSTLNFNFAIAYRMFEEPVKIGEIEIGYLRSGDKVGSEGNDDLTVWYQDGTKRTINKSWFEN